MMKREFSMKPGAPRAADVAAAFADRSAPLPVPRVNTRTEGTYSRKVVPSNLGYLEQRESAALTTGEVAPNSRLDRTRNLELGIRQSMLKEFNHDQALACKYFLMVLGLKLGGALSPAAHHQGEHGSSEVRGGHTVMDDANENDKGEHSRESTRAQQHAQSIVRQATIAEGTMKQREFVEALKVLAGPSWVRTVHVTDLNFMSYMLCQRGGANRMANRLFPGAILSNDTTQHRSTESFPSAVAASTETQEFTFSSKSDNAVELSSAKERQSSICRTGPFDSFEIRKQHALCGLKTARNGPLKQSETANLLMTYRQCRSPVPVPSQWAREDFKTIEMLTRQSATQTPPVRLKPLHFWSGAGRTDGRTIPLVVPVLQASSATGEQILAAGCVVLAEAPCSVLQTPAVQRTACSMNDTIAATTMPAAAPMHETETEKSPALDEPLQPVKEEKQERQRRFSGHIHQITAFAVSPCGLYVASASIGPTRDTSVLLAWRLSDGLPVNALPDGQPPASVEGGSEVDPVLEAGGSCVLAKGCFDGGVGGLVSMGLPTL
jgi:hypothetical protein